MEREYTRPHNDFPYSSGYLDLQCMLSSRIGENLSDAEYNSSMITREEIVSSENLMLAMKQVVANDGAPGIDGITCDKLPEWFRKHTHELTSAILDKTYRPLPIGRVYIPKDNGEKRPLVFLQR